MKSKSNISSLVALSALMVLAPLNVKASANEWVSLNGDWKYKVGDSYKTGWFEDQKCWYLADYQTGILKKGWVASGDAWYYLNPANSIMQESVWVEQGKYYVTNNGVMAADTIIDGKEILEDGTAINLADSKSVVLTDPNELVGKVIEGNLYISEEAAKDLVLNDIHVKGKIVIEGGETITLNNVISSSVKNNKAQTTIKFEGSTQVDQVIVARSTHLAVDDKYKGTIKNVIIQSMSKTDTVIDVKADEVTSSTYASTTINAEVGKVTLKQESTFKLNANVKELLIQASAGSSKIELAKDVTVDHAIVSSKSTFTGDGTIVKLEAKSDDIKIDTIVNEVVVDDKVKNPPTNSDNKVLEPETSKPSGGGSTGDGGGSTGGGGGSTGGGGGNTGGGGGNTEEIKKVVNTFDELKTALTSSKEIEIASGKEIVLTSALELPSDVTLTLKNNSKLVLSNPLTVNGKLENYGEITTVVEQDVEPVQSVLRNKSTEAKLTINGEVNIYDGSEVVFGAISEIAKDGNPFIIKGNTKIIIGSNTYVGEDGEVTLSKLAGSSSDVLGKFKRSGDGFAYLDVYQKANVNDNLSFSLSGYYEESEIYMTSTYTMETTGIIIMPLNGKSEVGGLSYIPCKLFIDNKQIAGVEGEANIYSDMGEFNMMHVSKSSVDLVFAISGYAVVDNTDGYFAADKKIIESTNPFSSVLINVIGGSVKLYTENLDTSVDAEKNSFYTYGDNSWSKLEDSNLTISNFLVDEEPHVGQFLQIITEPRFALYDVEWIVGNESKKGTTYEVQQKDLGQKITVSLTAKSPFITNEGKPIEIVTKEVTAKENISVTSEALLYFKAFNGDNLDITVGGLIEYKGTYGQIRVLAGSSLSLSDGHSLTLNDSGSGNPLLARVDLFGGTLNLQSASSLIITKGALNVYKNSTLVVGETEVLNTVSAYSAEGAPLQYVATSADKPQGVSFVNNGKSEYIKVTEGTLHLTTEGYEALVSAGFTITLGAESHIYLGENGTEAPAPNEILDVVDTDNETIIEDENISTIE